MRPTLAAEDLRRGIVQYLTTTFALGDAPTRDALEDFFTDPDTGLFRGPYLRIRTPFRKAEKGWREGLEWAPTGFTPYRHQARAFERLSTRNGPAEPTLVTTGTGSGKTEAFLLPVLDHCMRARRAGHRGIKAILLYPMNALATDQAHRIEDLLRDPVLQHVTAALYIGDVPGEAGFEQVLTRRAEIRRARPDILLTNYKMLDLLLQRAEDQPLWDEAALAYVVVDEFHTYDGAQGTDVAMLLRRLAAATGQSRPGRPLGDICPVATSATLGSNRGDDPDSNATLLAVASQVFGTAFPPGSIIGENRLSVEEFVGDLDYFLPLPDPRDLARLPDPGRDHASMAEIAAAVVGDRGHTPAELGGVLRRHVLTQALLEALGDGPANFAEVLERLPRRGAYAWGAAIRSDPELAATALARYVALLSTARDPDDADDPLLHIETHLWVRAVSRLLRAVGDEPRFCWDGETPEPSSGGHTLEAPIEPAETADDEDVTAVPGTPGSYLPAVYCRHCGRSGWAAISPEKSPTELVTSPDRIYRADAAGDKRRLRALIRANAAEARRSLTDRDRRVQLLHRGGDHVRPLDEAHDLSRARRRDEVLVLADLRKEQAADRAAEEDRCPACNTDNGIRFLGAGAVALAAVAVTQLFTGGELIGADRKTLLFSDSVQDAAHRAGYVADRSYTFSLRALLAAQLRPETPTALNDLVADLVTAASDPDTLAAVVPPDLYDKPGVDGLLTGAETPEDTWELVAQRLAFAAICEFGLRSRQGRTLELTRTATAEVALAEPAAAAALARDVHLQLPHQLDGALPAENRYLVFLHGMLERLRMRGAVNHRWLDGYLRQAAVRRWPIWGGRPTGMPAFPSGVSAPTFLLGGPKTASAFDYAGAPGGWYADWAVRCLAVNRDAAAGYLTRLLPVLAGEGVLAVRNADDGTPVYGLQPGHIQVQPLSDGHVADAVVVCDTCTWRQTVHPDRRGLWAGHPCPRYRCPGALRDGDDSSSASRHGGADFRDDYYRRLYRTAGTYHVVAVEHTGMLSRRAREEVEEGFRRGVRYTDPNVLSCTPTLELGIDIGDLSAVILASLPAGPANYVQRVGRAGRRSGDAMVVALAERSPRDLYYLDEPTEMIAGEIIPPGCYLSAVELLRRQYVAHLVDLTARGRLPGIPPLPRFVSQVFGPTGWLEEFVAAAQRDGAELVEEFLALFPRVGPADADTADSDPAEAADRELRHFAVRGLANTAREAERTWNARLDDLRARLTAIDEAKGALVPSDPHDQTQARALRAERYAVVRHLRDLGRMNAHSALVELGLLPNYSLLDTSTVLEATVYWQEPGADGEPRFGSELRDYSRPSSHALTELAPDNTFYIQGYQHTVTGLDIGTPDRPRWEQWRVCPECGHVRTHRAADDTSRCPRCDSGGIGDNGCLHKVLRPNRVTARERRDDARITDDRDDRRRVYYETGVAVDIAPTDVAPGAWRHVAATFGVDFARRAVVRRFNLGRSRPAGSPDARFAGRDRRLGGFQVCTACGYARTEDDGHGTSDAMSVPGGVDREAQRHRPWCPRRRGVRTVDEALILAHELETEAVRILVPAATIAIDTRLVSFTAALQAGLAARYGGSPDHLRVTQASMPDPATGHRRWFLVLYDSLPGGTGYLHRLRSPEEFSRVLLAARTVIEGCRCVREGRPACHRCLLRHVQQDEYDLVSRGEAVSILRELLGERDEGWAVHEVEHAATIPLVDQVESELEKRFVEGLGAWAEDPATPGTMHATPDPSGRTTLDLRVTAPDGSKVTHWQAEVQKNLRDHRPDVWFQRLDDAPLRVALYLDGYRYHAEAGHNRLADDADQRARLRADGAYVFQLTWDDVVEWTDRPAGQREGWHPYHRTAQHAARQFYQQRTGRRGAELDELVWANPVELVLAFLADPDPSRWRSRAEAALAGMLAQPDASKSIANSRRVGGVLWAALTGEELPADNGGGITVVHATDIATCPIVLAVDQRAAGDPAWTACTVLDDRDTTISTEVEVHRARWASWLRWGDLVQFLPDGGGDGLQLARTGLASFDPAVLAVSGGTGALVALRAETAPEEEPPAADVIDAVPMDVVWRDALELVDPDEPGLRSLARALAAQGVPAPEVGYELGEGAWQAELAWPDQRVAVVLGDPLHHSPDDHEARGRNDAYRAAGWEVRSATDWAADSLANHILAHSGHAGPTDRDPDDPRREDHW